MAVASYRGDHITVDLLWSALPPLRAARDGRVLGAGHADRHGGLHLDVRRKVLDTRADHVGTFDLRQPVWIYYLIAWIGLAVGRAAAGARTVRLVFWPEKLARYRRHSRSIESRPMSTDAVAVTGFLSLFALMLLRVPVGIAMGLGRRARLRLHDRRHRPGAEAPGAVADPHRDRRRIRRHSAVPADGRLRLGLRHEPRTVPRLQHVSRPSARRARHRHHRRLRRLCRDLRLVGRHRRDLLQGRLSGDARSTAIRRASPPA